MRRPIIAPSLTLLILVIPAGPVMAQGWYVSPNGNDANAGTSTAAPFRSIQQAANQTNPGDTVYLMAGTHTYTPWDPTYAVAWIARSGSPGNDITYRNAPGAYPTVAAGSHRMIFNINASWVRFDAIKFVGQRSSISLDEARSWQNTPYTSMPDGVYDRMNGTGLYITARDGAHPENLVVQNCEITECSASGVYCGSADYVTIQANTIYDNCQRTNQGTSAVNLFDVRHKAGNTDTSTKYVIQNNKIFNNETLINWDVVQAISDGNGIIVDYTTNYNGAISIQNNAVWNNGGAGIAATKSRRVFIFGNTVYRNSRSSALDWGNIMDTDSTEIYVRNNLIVARSNKVLFKNTTSGFNYNLYWHDGAAVWTIGGNDVTGNPQFVKVPANDWDGSADFDLKANSPAKNRANGADLPGVDLLWRSRPYGGGCDIGAFETRN